MKTQIITLAILIASFTFTNTYGKTLTEAETVASNVEINEMNDEFLETGAEAELNVEDWMTSNTLWRSANVDTGVTEENLEIEDWMTDEELWSNEDKTVEKNYSVGGVKYKIVKMKKVQEEPLVIRRWMVNDKYWNM